MHALLRIANVLLLLGMIVCCAGAVAGLIVFLPVVAGAWALNLVGLLGYEEAAEPHMSDREQAQPAAVSSSGRADIGSSRLGPAVDEAA
jgi:hypothetical protein